MTQAEGEIVECKLVTETKKGTRIGNRAKLRFAEGRIEFLVSPFGLKDEIKAMKGSKWHGFESPPRKIWSVEDCPRNRFQLSYLRGENCYEWFDRDLVSHTFDRPLMPHQKDLTNTGLTYHFGIWAAEMGTGKTLAAIELMERSGVTEWYYVGPKAALKAIEREFKKWKLNPKIKVTLLTYEALVREMDSWPNDRQPPKGVIFDESSRLKTATSQRTRAAQKLADLIRSYYKYDGFVLLMSGTPSPKTPVDWWAQAEIAFPGFLKEGSAKALEQRLAFLVDQALDSGVFKKRIGWKDNEKKCDVCGQFATANIHDEMLAEDENHDFVPSKNEVAFMHERLDGLVVVKHKKDCLTLPEKRYRTIICKPSKSTLRVAQALMSGAQNTITGLTLMRELSDGFQYREEADGKTSCTHCSATGKVEEWFDPNDDERTFACVEMLNPETVASLEKRTVDCPNCGGTKEVTKYIRTVREVPCPKEAALIQLLEECEETGRIVVAAGFTGSVDRCVNICLKQKWDVVRCDGRGFTVLKAQSDGQIEELRGVDALDYWADMEGNTRVAFVMHPESGGMGLTLIESRMMVYWSNSFKPEYRVQSEDRIHRKGMDENLGCEIVDLVHLPTDQRVLDVIRDNRKLELMSMGEFVEVLKDESVAGSGELVEFAA